MIRYATPEDIDICQTIARQWDKGRYLGYVRRVSLQESQQARELLVAEQDGQVIGFVRFHACRDGWQTVRDLAVDRQHLSRGIGRALLYSVPTPLRLVCSADNDLANSFYLGAGLTHAGTSHGKRRDLNVWQMRILNIIVRGADKNAPAICRKSGSAYGVQERHSVPACECGAESQPGVVLDPFGGTGTVALVARRLSIDYTLIELNPEYHAMALVRLSQTDPFEDRITSNGIQLTLFQEA